MSSPAARRDVGPHRAASQRPPVTEPQAAFGQDSVGAEESGRVGRGHRGVAANRCHTPRLLWATHLPTDGKARPVAYKEGTIWE